MQFEKCLTCPLIKEKQCTGPKFMRASTRNVVEWLFAYMKLNGITNAHLAETSGIPKGTIDGLKKREDIRHETLYPLLRAAIEMTGGIWDGEHCPAVVSGIPELQRLTQELDRTKSLLTQREREKKECATALICMFGLCVGLILLLLLFHL